MTPSAHLVSARQNHTFVCVFAAVQVTAAARSVSRDKCSVSSTARAVCDDLGVFEPQVDAAAAEAFENLLRRLLMRCDKDFAARVTAAVLPFVSVSVLSFYPSQLYEFEPGEHVAEALCEHALHHRKCLHSDVCTWLFVSDRPSVK
jgi:hypothetical protein